MKIAVTSASGQLGSHIIEQLKNDIGAENVLGLARTPEKASGLGVEIRKGDYTQAEDFVSGLEGMDAVIILSGNDEPSKRIGQHRNIIEGAKKNGLRKIVYTSITGAEEGNAFSPIVSSNRQSEEDVKNSGMDWVIGRNGIYIEPDLEYVDNYIKEGGIRNSAADGLCAYTSRSELAVAYSKMAQGEEHHGQSYNLVGEPITQKQLADLINEVYGTSLEYLPMSVEEYLEERKQALGNFLGTVIGGIYSGIRDGYFNPPSDFEKATGRTHVPARELIHKYKQSIE